MTTTDPVMILVHGSCHGGWCWQDTITLLRAEGQEARAIDLPGRGGVPAGPPPTLADQARAILGAAPGPLVLVGHSAGGQAIGLAAAMAPQRIAGLVYLAAYVPLPGQSLADRRRSWPEQPLRAAIRIDAARAAFTLDPGMAADLLYHDCPAAVQRQAVARLCAEPIAPQEEPFPGLPLPGSAPAHDTGATQHTWPAQHAGPAHYIVCTEDRAVPPAFQRQMAAGFAPAHVSTLPASHSPFLSMPGRLARRLTTIARTARPG